MRVYVDFEVHQRRFSITGMHYAAGCSAVAKLCCNMQLVLSIPGNYTSHAHTYSSSIRMASKYFHFNSYISYRRINVPLCFLSFSTTCARNRIGAHIPRIKWKPNWMRTMFLHLYLSPLTILLFSFSRRVSFFFFFSYNHT